MQVILCIVICCILSLTGRAGAAVLYLQDGGEVSCSHISREPEVIVAKVTGGGTVFFSPEEVDLKKSFPAPAKTAARKKAGRTLRPKEEAKEVIVVDPRQEQRKEEILREFEQAAERLTAPERRRAQAQKAAEKAREMFRPRYE